MVTDPPPSSPSDEERGEPQSKRDGPTCAWCPTAHASQCRLGSRAGRASLLILLIVFMLQNSTKVEVPFLVGLAPIPLGMALLIAAVGAGLW